MARLAANEVAVGQASGAPVAMSGDTLRTALGLAIGTNVQAYSAKLDAIAALATTDGGFIVGDGSTFVLETGSTVRSSLGLGSLATANTINNSNWSGTDLAVANGGTGSSTAADARTALGLAIGTNVQAYSAALASLSDIESASELTSAGIAATDIVGVWDDDANAWKKMPFQQMGTRVQAAATQTLAIDDNNTVIWNDSSSTYTITVPPNSSVAFPIGATIRLDCTSTGRITVAAGSGVTIVSMDSSLSVMASGGSAVLLKLSTDTWALSGAIEAT
jgi:hypothetical protein